MRDDPHRLDSRVCLRTDHRGQPWPPVTASLFVSQGNRDVLKMIPREGGATWNYEYNLRDEVSAGRKKFSGGALFVPGHQFTYAYDGIGNRTGAGRGGDESGGGLSAISYTTNARNEYLHLTTPKSMWVTGEALAAANVVINDGPGWRNGTFFGREIKLGNITSATVTGVTLKAIQQDGFDLLTRTEVGAVYTPPAEVAPSYDADGNLTNDGLWDYGWDGENRLTSMTMVSAIPEAQRVRLEFTYDFEGRRVQKKKLVRSGSSWVAPSSDGTRKFLYDGWNLIAEQSDAVKYAYLWGADLSGTLDGAGGVGGLLAMLDLNAGKSYFYASDYNGNVTAMVDSATQAVVARYEYGPFGEPLRASGPMAKVNPFRWSSKITDNESGLVYYGYRYYNSLNGRWVSRDPIEENGGKNLYAFVNNNGVNGCDILGLLPNIPLPPPYPPDLTFPTWALLKLGGDQLGAEFLWHFMFANGSPYHLELSHLRSFTYTPDLNLSNFPGIWQKVSNWLSTPSPRLELSEEEVVTQVGGAGNNAIGQAVLHVKGLVCKTGSGRTRAKFWGEFKLTDHYDFYLDEAAFGRSWQGNLKNLAGFLFARGTPFDVFSDWVEVEQTVPGSDPWTF